MRWVAAYVVGILVTSVVALPLWNAGLREAAGRWISIEQIHLLEYAGLGAVVGWRVPRRISGRLLGLIAGVGVADELLQSLLPNRFFQWTDVWLNWAGGAMGLVGLRVMRWMKSS